MPTKSPPPAPPKATVKSPPTAPGKSSKTSVPIAPKAAVTSPPAASGKSSRTSAPIAPKAAVKSPPAVPGNSSKAASPVPPKAAEKSPPAKPSKPSKAASPVPPKATGKSPPAPPAKPPKAASPAPPKATGKSPPAPPSKAASPVPPKATGKSPPAPPGKPSNESSSKTPSSPPIKGSIPSSPLRKDPSPTVQESDVSSVEQPDEVSNTVSTDHTQNNKVESNAVSDSTKGNNLKYRGNVPESVNSQKDSSSSDKVPPKAPPRAPKPVDSSEMTSPVSTTAPKPVESSELTSSVTAKNPHSTSTAVPTSTDTNQINAKPSVDNTSVMNKSRRVSLSKPPAAPRVVSTSNSVESSNSTTANKSEKSGHNETVSATTTSLHRSKSPGVHTQSSDDSGGNTSRSRKAPPSRAPPKHRPPPARRPPAAKPRKGSPAPPAPAKRVSLSSSLSKSVSVTVNSNTTSSTHTSSSEPPSTAGAAKTNETNATTSSTNATANSTNSTTNRNFASTTNSSNTSAPVHSVSSFSVTAFSTVPSDLSKSAAAAVAAAPTRNALKRQPAGDDINVSSKQTTHTSTTSNSGHTLSTTSSTPPVDNTQNSFSTSAESQSNSTITTSLVTSSPSAQTSSENLGGMSKEQISEVLTDKDKLTTSNVSIATAQVSSAANSTDVSSSTTSFTPSTTTSTMQSSNTTDLTIQSTISSDTTTPKSTTSTTPGIVSSQKNHTNTTTQQMTDTPIDNDTSTQMAESLLRKFVRKTKAARGTNEGMNETSAKQTHPEKNKTSLSVATSSSGQISTTSTSHNTDTTNTQDTFIQAEAASVTALVAAPVTASELGQPANQSATKSATVDNSTISTSIASTTSSSLNLSTTSDSGMITNSSTTLGAKTNDSSNTKANSEIKTTTITTSKSISTATNMSTSTSYSNTITPKSSVTVSNQSKLSNASTTSSHTITASSTLPSKFSSIPSNLPSTLPVVSVLQEIKFPMKSAPKTSSGNAKTTTPSSNMRNAQSTAEPNTLDTQKLSSGSTKGAIPTNTTSTTNPTRQHANAAVSHQPATTSSAAFSDDETDNGQEHIGISQTTAKTSNSSATTHRTQVHRSMSALEPELQGLERDGRISAKRDSTLTTVEMPHQRIETERVPSGRSKSRPSIFRRLSFRPSASAHSLNTSNASDSEASTQQTNRPSFFQRLRNRRKNNSPSADSSPTTADIQRKFAQLADKALAGEELSMTSPRSTVSASEADKSTKQYRNGASHAKVSSTPKSTQDPIISAQPTNSAVHDDIEPPPLPDMPSLDELGPPPEHLLAALRAPLSPTARKTRDFNELNMPSIQLSERTTSDKQQRSKTGPSSNDANIQKTAGTLSHESSKQKASNNLKAKIGELPELDLHKFDRLRAQRKLEDNPSQNSLATIKTTGTNSTQALMSSKASGKKMESTTTNSHTPAAISVAQQSTSQTGVSLNATSNAHSTITSTINASHTATNNTSDSSDTIDKVSKDSDDKGTVAIPSTNVHTSMVATQAPNSPTGLSTIAEDETTEDGRTDQSYVGHRASMYSILQEDDSRSRGGSTSSRTERAIHSPSLGPRTSSSSSLHSDPLNAAHASVASSTVSDAISAALHTIGIQKTSPSTSAKLQSSVVNHPSIISYPSIEERCDMSELVKYIQRIQDALHETYTGVVDDHSHKHSHTHSHKHTSLSRTFTHFNSSTDAESPLYSLPTHNLRSIHNKARNATMSTQTQALAFLKRICAVIDMFSSALWQQLRMNTTNQSELEMSNATQQRISSSGENTNGTMDTLCLYAERLPLRERPTNHAKYAILLNIRLALALRIRPLINTLEQVSSKSSSFNLHQSPVRSSTFESLIGGYAHQDLHDLLRGRFINDANTLGLIGSRTDMPVLPFETRLLKRLRSKYAFVRAMKLLTSIMRLSVLMSSDTIDPSILDRQKSITNDKIDQNIRSWLQVQSFKVRFMRDTLSDVSTSLKRSLHEAKTSIMNAELTLSHSSIQTSIDELLTETKMLKNTEQGDDPQIVQSLNHPYNQWLDGAMSTIRTKAHQTHKTLMIEQSKTRELDKKLQLTRPAADQVTKLKQKIENDLHATHATIDAQRTAEARQTERITVQTQDLDKQVLVSAQQRSELHKTKLQAIYNEISSQFTHKGMQQLQEHEQEIQDHIRNLRESAEQIIEKETQHVADMVGKQQQNELAQRTKVRQEYTDKCTLLESQLQTLSSQIDAIKTSNNAIRRDRQAFEEERKAHEQQLIHHERKIRTDAMRTATKKNAMNEMKTWRKLLKTAWKLFEQDILRRNKKYGLNTAKAHARCISAQYVFMRRVFRNLSPNEHVTLLLESYTAHLNHIADNDRKSLGITNASASTLHKSHLVSSAVESHTGTENIPSRDYSTGIENISKHDYSTGIKNVSQRDYSTGIKNVSQRDYSTGIENVSQRDYSVRIGNVPSLPSSVSNVSEHAHTISSEPSVSVERISTKNDEQDMNASSGTSSNLVLVGYNPHVQQHKELSDTQNTVEDVVTQDEITSNGRLGRLLSKMKRSNRMHDSPRIRNAPLDGQQHAVLLHSYRGAATRIIAHRSSAN